MLLYDGVEVPAVYAPPAGADAWLTVTFAVAVALELLLLPPLYVVVGLAVGYGELDGIVQW